MYSNNCRPALSLCPERRGFCLCLLLVNKPLNTGANVNLYKFVVVCLDVVVYAAIFVVLGSETSAETPPTETNAAIVTLPESTNSIGMKFKLIPAGTFMMGDETGNRDETPHEVTLTKHFKMGVHEVTQDQYKQVMGVNPSHFEAANNPVEHVSWVKAVEFCRKLSELPAEKRQEMFIACQPKRSGSMPAVLEQQQRTVLVTMMRT